MSKNQKSSSDLKGANKGNSLNELIQTLKNCKLDNLICDLNTELELQKDLFEFVEIHNLNDYFQNWLENKYREEATNV